MVAILVLIAIMMIVSWLTWSICRAASKIPPVPTTAMLASQGKMTLSELQKIAHHADMCAFSNWLQGQIKAGATWEETMEKMPAAWYLWSARFHGETARIDWCAERNPIAALRYAPDLLAPERREWCKKQIGVKLR